MPEEIEIETNELQETIEELHEERRERAEEAKATAWTRYIALTTAFLAVFAAVGALQSGALVNEALINQLHASDTWAQYQADKQKGYLFSTQAYALLDRGIAPAPASPLPEARPEAKGEAKPAHKASGWQGETPGVRLRDFIDQADKEATKTEELQREAKKLEIEAHELIERHHRFAWAVALMQVAIALSAIAALTRIRSVWGVSLLVGVTGIVFFCMGFAGR